MFAKWFNTARCVRSARACAVLAGIACVFSWAAASTLAANTDIVRVEEKWELVVKQPDTTTVSPQVTCIISPHGHADGLFAAFNLNHKSYPTWVPGGLQLQLWNGDAPIAGYNFPHDELLNTSDEVVRWTQSMELVGTQLKFEILRGHSTTWGDFGGQGYLRAYVESPVQDLNNYSSDISVANSGISYAANRVTSLKLLRVRAYNRNGDLAEDSTVKVVYAHE